MFHVEYHSSDGVVAFLRSLCTQLLVVLYNTI